MTHDEILAKLSDIIRDVFDDESLQPTDAMTAEDVTEWDSTNHVRLMVAVEGEFGIRFETDEITAPETVGQLVELIQSKVAS